MPAEGRKARVPPITPAHLHSHSHKNSVIPAHALRHSRTPPTSFPRTREPSEKQTTPIAPPSQSEGGRERSEQGDARPSWGGLW